MADMIPIELALSHLREDAGVADALVTLYTGAAIKAASNFLNREIYATTEDMAAAVLAGTAGPDPIVADDAIKAAILLTLGKLYAFREDVVVGTSSSVMELPSGAKQLLYPSRVELGV